MKVLSCTIHDNGNIMYGLKYKPDLGSKFLNDLSFYPGEERVVHDQFSERNHMILSKYFEPMMDSARAILEIGVCDSGDYASMQTLIAMKHPDCVFLGIDVKDKTVIADPVKNIYTMKINSSETEKVMKRLEALTWHRKIDFLHIDGWHSVNQILRDWKYAEFLSPDGVIAVHDTNCHPGPVELFKALDPDIFEGKTFFHEHDNDWGIGIIKKVRS